MWAKKHWNLRFVAWFLWSNLTWVSLVCVECWYSWQASPGFASNPAQLPLDAGRSLAARRACPSAHPDVRPNIASARSAASGCLKKDEEKTSECGFVGRTSATSLSVEHKSTIIFIVYVSSLNLAFITHKQTNPRYITISTSNILLG